MKNTVHFVLTSFPILLVIFEQLHNSFRNILGIKTNLPDSKNIAPDIMISWIQISIGTIMFLILAFVLAYLLKLNWNVINKKHTYIGWWGKLLLALAVLFGLPAIWELFWISQQAFSGSLNVKPHWLYLIVALSIPYISCLTIKRIFDNYRLNKSNAMTN